MRESMRHGWELLLIRRTWVASPFQGSKLAPSRDEIYQMSPTVRIMALSRQFLSD